MIFASSSILILHECSRKNDVTGGCFPENEHVYLLSRQRHVTWSNDDVTRIQNALRGACLELGDVTLVPQSGLLSFLIKLAELKHRILLVHLLGFSPVDFMKKDSKPD